MPEEQLSPGIFKHQQAFRARCFYFFPQTLFTIS